MGPLGTLGRMGSLSISILAVQDCTQQRTCTHLKSCFQQKQDSIFESSTVFSCTREEYEVAGIDCLQIRQEEGDVGSVVYDSANYTQSIYCYRKFSSVWEDSGAA